MDRAIQFRTGCRVVLCLAAWLIGCVSLSSADERQQFPFSPLPYNPPPALYSNWPTTWTPLVGLNDPDDLADAGANNDNHLDFVGNDTYPGAYWAQDNNYIYFRVRMDVNAVTTHATDPNDSNNTYDDTVHVLIDRVGWGQEGGLPDFGFTWDSKETYAQHGLEMTEFDTSN